MREGGFLPRKGVGIRDCGLGDGEDGCAYPFPASKKNAIPAIKPNMVVSSWGSKRPMAMRKAPETIPTARIQAFFSQRLVETCA